LEKDGPLDRPEETMKNRMPAPCKVCGNNVAAGEGALAKENGAWKVTCQKCSGEAPAVKIQLTQEGANVVIKPTGYLNDQFDAYRAACEGAKYDGIRKCQVAPLAKTPAIVAKLHEAGFVVDMPPSLAATLSATVESMRESVESAYERAAEVDARLRARNLALFPFQKKGIAWLAGRSGAMLSDEMGLGKTIQALTSLPEGVPVVVVAPAVAKGVWAREAQKWRPDFRVTVLSGRGSYRHPEPGELVIINYDILPTEVGPAPAGLCLLSDESHVIKGSKTQRTIRFRALSEAAREAGGRVWMLTATPMLNKPQELWNILQAGDLAREAFGSYRQFVELFNGHQDSWGGMVWGTPKPEVADRLRRVILRRLRSEVLPELPTKSWSTITVEIDSKTRKLCEKTAKALAEMGIDLSKGLPKTMAAFEQMSAMRAALAKCKMGALLEMVEGYEEQDEPIVVFSAHREPVDMFKGREGWAVITGDTKPEERTAIEEAFQNGRLRGVAGTIKAMGVAITLTRAHIEIFVDREWTPALNSQAEDRCCRIGQTNGVVVYNLVADHPIDERVSELLTQKQALIAASVDSATNVMPTASVPEIDFEALARAAEEQAAAADKARAEAEERRRFFEAKRARGEFLTPEVSSAPSADVPVRRAPQNPREMWMVESLRLLAHLDPDHAGTKNDMGFDGGDTIRGHRLAADSVYGWTEKQWELAALICRKYHRQVGNGPE
jgi:hypothetical protein